MLGWKLVQRMVKPALMLALLAACIPMSKVSLTIDTEPGDGAPVMWQLNQIMSKPGGGPDVSVREQAFSMLGREDLLAKDSSSYTARPCEPGSPRGDPVAAIVAAARGHRIVIINEAHDWSAHRAFVADVARALAREGFTYYAAETFGFEPRRTPAPWLRDREGFYSREAVFGRLVRDALALGYELVPYEPFVRFASEEDKKAHFALPPSERMARREEGQARNLVQRVFEKDKQAKILIHAGYGHANEVPRPIRDGEAPLVWMAAHLKQITGLDPLTINQTICRGSSEEIRLAAAPDGVPPGSFDLYVDHPLPKFEYGRPTWRQERGDVPTDIPPELVPKKGWAVIEARPLDEPDEAVPMDRVAVRAGETDVKLMLPPGKYRVKAIVTSQSK